MARQRVTESGKTASPRRTPDADLKERIKELECLYRISGVLERLDVTPEAGYVEVLEVIRSAFQYPDRTGVEVAIRNKSYRTDDFGLTRWRISRPIKIGRRSIGVLAVAYLGRDRGRSPFLEEERRLLTAVAERLGLAAERLEMAAQLQNSERFYRSLFTSANDGILLHHVGGRILMANKAMARMSGYSVAELLKMSVSDLLSREPARMVRENETVRSSARTALRRHMRMTTKSGDVRYVEVTENRLANAEGDIVTQTIVRDVTAERRQSESIHAYAGQVINAQENERKRIARELHDETVQALLSLGMDIDALVATHHGFPPSLVARLSELRDRAKGIGDGVKDLMRGLRPPLLDEIGLLGAIRSLTSEATRQRALETEFELLGTPRRLSPEAEVTVFRIAQEALTNVIKHSGATRARVSLQFGDSITKLVVTDNGHGFNLAKATRELGASGKMGLAGMEERARLLNGALGVESTADGTTVVLEAPV